MCYALSKDGGGFVEDSFSSVRLQPRAWGPSAVSFFAHHGLLVLDQKVECVLSARVKCVGWTRVVGWLANLNTTSSPLAISLWRVDALLAWRLRTLPKDTPAGLALWKLGVYESWKGWEGWVLVERKQPPEPIERGIAEYLRSTVARRLKIYFDQVGIELNCFLARRFKS